MHNRILGYRVDALRSSIKIHICVLVLHHRHRQLGGGAMQQYKCLSFDPRCAFLEGQEEEREEDKKKQKKKHRRRCNTVRNLS